VVAWQQRRRRHRKNAARAIIVCCVCFFGWNCAGVCGNCAAALLRFTVHGLREEDHTCGAILFFPERQSQHLYWYC